MCFNVCAVHHLEKTWRDHEVFDPNRFMNSNLKSSGGEAPSAFFGLGLRQCPARHFATWELRTVVAMLLKEYRWSLPEEGSIHKDAVKNAFSFGTNLNLPHDLGIRFWKLDLDQKDVVEKA